MSLGPKAVAKNIYEFWQSLSVDWLLQNFTMVGVAAPFGTTTNRPGKSLCHVKLLPRLVSVELEPLRLANGSTLSHHHFSNTPNIFSRRLLEWTLNASSFQQVRTNNIFYSKRIKNRNKKCRWNICDCVFDINDCYTIFIKYFIIHL